MLQGQLQSQLRGQQSQLQGRLQHQHQGYSQVQPPTQHSQDSQHGQQQTEEEEKAAEDRRQLALAVLSMSSMRNTCHHCGADTSHLHPHKRSRLSREHRNNTL